MGSSKGINGELSHLAAYRAPVGTGGTKGHGNWGGSRRLGLGGKSTKHDTTGEDSGLSAIVVGHLGLGVVNKDLCGTSSFPARHLRV